MTKFNQTQNDFTSGKLSPKLVGRTNVKEYFSGCKDLLNMLIMSVGGATRRPGTRFVEFASVTSPCRLFNFKFSIKESYIVVMSMSSGLPYLSIRDLNGDGIIGSLFMYTTFMSTEEKEDLFGWNVAQSADAMFFVHRSGKAPPQVLKRLAADNFSLSLYSTSFYDTALKRVLAQPFKDLNASSITLDPNAGGTTLTSSVAFFNAGHVGAYFRYLQASGVGNEGLYLVTAYNSPTEVDVTELLAPSARDASLFWQEGAFSGSEGYPKTVFVVEQRLVFGGTVKKPDTLFFSKTGNLWQMMQDRLLQDTSTTDASGLGFFGDELSTDPFFATISSEEVDEITWLGGFRNLLVGTLGAERVVTSTTFLSEEDISIKKQTANGGKNIKPVQVGNTLYFVAVDGRRLYSYKYNDENGSFISKEISLLYDTFLHHNATEDFFDIEIKEMSYDRSRNCIWIVTTINELIGITVDQSSEAIAWHPHTIGGTDVKVLSAYPISRIDTGFTDLYLLVQRTINGSTIITLEKIGPSFEETSLYNTSTSNDAKPIFLDSAVVVRGATEILGTGETEEGMEVGDDTIIVLE